MAFNRGDMDAAVASVDPQIEWTEPAESPGAGTYHGRDAAKGYLTQSRAAWPEVISEPERFIPAGNRIVVFVPARVKRAARNGKRYGSRISIPSVTAKRSRYARSRTARRRCVGWSRRRIP